MSTLTVTERHEVTTELDMLHAELQGLQHVEPVSRKAADNLVKKRNRAIGEMRRLEGLLRHG